MGFGILLGSRSGGGLTLPAARFQSLCHILDGRHSRRADRGRRAAVRRHSLRRHPSSYFLAANRDIPPKSDALGGVSLVAMMQKPTCGEAVILPALIGCIRL